MKRTFQPSVIKRKRTHGFRARMATKNGRIVLSRRRAKGRKRLTVWSSKRLSKKHNRLWRVPVTYTPVGDIGLKLESPSQNQECLVLDFGFSKQKRLLSPREFKAVFDGAIYKASNRHLLLLAIPSHSSRLGLVVAKKHARHAVQRNRLKRLLRESFRHHQHELKDLDIIALVKPGLWQQNNIAICKIIDAQWRYLLKQKTPPKLPATNGNQSINRQKTLWKKQYYQSCDFTASRLVPACLHGAVFIRVAPAIRMKL